MTFVYLGNFQRNSIGEPEIANCLEKLGHKVVRLQEFETSIQDIKQHKFDILLFAKFRVKDAPDEREKFIKSVKSVCWIFDKYFGLSNEEAI